MRYRGVTNALYDRGPGTKWSADGVCSSCISSPHAHDVFIIHGLRSLLIDWCPWPETRINRNAVDVIMESSMRSVDAGEMCENSIRFLCKWVCRFPFPISAERRVGRMEECANTETKPIISMIYLRCRFLCVRQHYRHRRRVRRCTHHTRSPPPPPRDDKQFPYTAARLRDADLLDLACGMMQRSLVIIYIIIIVRTMRPSAVHGASSKPSERAMQ